MKIAIIGAGNMGGAIARGLAKGHNIQPEDLIVSNPSEGKLCQLKNEFPEIRVTLNNKEAAAEAEIVILAVKPWLVETVLKELSIDTERQILASVAAGISLDQLIQWAGTNPALPVYRLVPNTAISQQESMTIIAAKNTTPSQDEFIADLFKEMGDVLFLLEDKIAAATALASCGIAYVLKYVQAAMQAGIELGLPAKVSQQLLAQTVKGAAELLMKNDTHPVLEIEKVCTPGGITIRGINTLDAEGFTSAIIKAMKSSS